MPAGSLFRKATPASWKIPTAVDLFACRSLRLRYGTRRQQNAGDVRKRRGTTRIATRRFRWALICAAVPRRAGTRQAEVSSNSPASTAFQWSERSVQIRAWTAPNGKVPPACKQQLDLILVVHAGPAEQFHETLDGLLANALRSSGRNRKTIT
jgi:hypothetical protein